MHTPKSSQNRPPMVAAWRPHWAPIHSHAPPRARHLSPCELCAPSVGPRRAPGPVAMDPARLAAVGAEFRATGVAHVPAFLPPQFVSLILRRLDEYGEHVLPRLDDSHAFYPDPDDRASVNFIDFGGSPAAAPERGSSLALSQHRPSAGWEAVAG